jgi:hypothetical protein
MTMTTSSTSLSHTAPVMVRKATMHSSHTQLSLTSTTCTHAATPSSHNSLKEASQCCGPSSWAHRLTQATSSVSSTSSQPGKPTILPETWLLGHFYQHLTPCWTDRPCVKPQIKSE